MDDAAPALEQNVGAILSFLGCFEHARITVKNYHFLVNIWKYSRQNDKHFQIFSSSRIPIY